MNVLSLFTGAGGGELAFQHLLDGFRTVGYVEINKRCQETIAQRIKDGVLENAPIFGDIRAFINLGSAYFYSGLVDIITAGFPCQPFSVAGKQLTEKDNRNLWPETIETIRIIRPATVFLENVPGLLASEYALTIFRQLRENGYQALPPLILGADDIGANHIRKRAWIVAESVSTGTGNNSGKATTNKRREARRDESTLRQTDRQNGTNRADTTSGVKGNVAYAEGRKPRESSKQEGWKNISRGSQKISNPDLNGTQWDKPKNRKGCGVVKNDWWATEPRLGRVAHGVANFLDILRTVKQGVS